MTKENFESMYETEIDTFYVIFSTELYVFEECCSVYRNFQVARKICKDEKSEVNRGIFEICWYTNENNEQSKFKLSTIYKIEARKLKSEFYDEHNKNVKEYLFVNIITEDARCKPIELLEIEQSFALCINNPRVGMFICKDDDNLEDNYFEYKIDWLDSEVCISVENNLSSAEHLQKVSKAIYASEYFLTKQEEKDLEIKQFAFDKLENMFIDLNNNDRTIVRNYFINNSCIFDFIMLDDDKYEAYLLLNDVNFDKYIFVMCSIKDGPLSAGFMKKET